LLALAVPRLGRAHPEFNPTRSNRYVKLSLIGGGAVRVAYTVMIGEVPAAAVRRAADANHDGEVDEKEAAAWAAAVQQSVGTNLAIDVDGARATINWEPPTVGGFTDRRVGPIPFSVDLYGRFPVGRGTHTVRLDDATPIDDLGDSEIRFEEGPGTKILAGWRARDDGKLETHFLFTGPKFSVIEDRSVGFRFSDGEKVKPRAPLPLGIGGALLGAAIAAFFLVRARARRKR
jgi:hypothetical protein